jgi:hypothetical protein
MIAAGVNAKALSVFMGHSSIKVTFDLYGQLMPGTEAQAAALLDDSLRGRNEQEGECHQPAWVGYVALVGAAEVPRSLRLT